MRHGQGALRDLRRKRLPLATDTRTSGEAESSCRSPAGYRVAQATDASHFDFHHIAFFHENGWRAFCTDAARRSRHDQLGSSHRIRRRRHPRVRCRFLPVCAGEIPRRAAAAGSPSGVSLAVLASRLTPGQIRCGHGNTITARPTHID